MALHLIKLCVGVDTIDELREFQAGRLQRAKTAGQPVEVVHITRMVPRRRAELLDGGSLYWVIRGLVRVRQRLVDIRSAVGEDGISRCHVVLDPALVPTVPQPRRPFQGWRYLKAQDVVSDLGVDETDAENSGSLRAELAALGLI